MPQTAPLHRPNAAPRALILAAGRGERMRPLTDTCPKPLLPVHGRPLIEHHLLALAAAGVQDVVINTAWLETQFPAALGDGSRWGLRLHYSTEGRDHGGALETAGGIAKALPWLAPQGDEAFWLVSGDIYAPGFAFDPATAQAFAASGDDALLWLVPNPSFHSAGDFWLPPQPGPAPGRLQREPPAGQSRNATYANLALVRPRLVADVQPGQHAPLGPRLFSAAQAGRLAGHWWPGPWENVGTPAQWARLQG
jgi:MurNAc alpha-1-phosphate uridylyltransferase